MTVRRVLDALVTGALAVVAFGVLGFALASAVLTEAECREVLSWIW